MKKILLICAAVTIISCGKGKTIQSGPIVLYQTTVTPNTNPEVISVIDHIKEVPVLCYHNITEDKNGGITVSRERFSEHMKLLADSGYQTILPDELYSYLTTGKAIHSRPIIISFDDTRGGQYKIALPIMEQHGFKAVFFVMTVCVGKPGYMSAGQLKTLSDRGNAIEAHTYDHPSMKNIKDSDWEKQLAKPKLLLEKIIQKPVCYFAYPNGVWTEKSIQQLKNFGYKAAFQLTNKKSETAPLYTIKRIMIQAEWGASHLQKTFLLPLINYFLKSQ